MRWVQSSDEQLYQGVYLKNQEEAVMLGFIIWAFVGIAVIAIGIFAFFFFEKGGRCMGQYGDV